VDASRIASTNRRWLEGIKRKTPARKIPGKSGSQNWPTDFFHKENGSAIATCYGGSVPNGSHFPVSLKYVALLSD